MTDLVKRRKRRRHNYKTGEDIDMLNERNYSQKKKRELPICDTHIDGA